MAGFHNSPFNVKVSFMLLLVTGLFHLVAYGVPFWTVRYNGYAGLWLGCNNGCYERWNIWIEEWIRVAQVFMTMALVTWFGATVCLFLFIFHKTFEQDRRLVFLADVATIATSLFIFIAIIVWAASEHYANGEILSWGYAFACLALFPPGVTGWLLYQELQKPNVFDDIENRANTLETTYLYSQPTVPHQKGGDVNMGYTKGGPYDSNDKLNL